jgi:Raf kinase inhibitor-like YbhB/YbcL family protein
MTVRAACGHVAPLLASVALLAAGCRPQATTGGTGKGAGAGAGKAIAMSLLDAGAALSVTSPDIRGGESIPDRFSDYEGGAIPTLRWSAAPAGTKSFAVVVEDPDAPSGEPFVHWLVYALPATATQVGAALPLIARQGTNSADGAAYMGPRPPAGDPPHHYHFEVFALDTVPALPAGADRAAFVNAARSHVLAKGELVATFQKG